MCTQQSVTFFLDNTFFQGHVNRTSPHWTMPPPAQQPRPYLQQQNQQVTTTQGSALIAQLTQPPSTTVNQFGQSNISSYANKLLFIIYFLSGCKFAN